MLHNYCNRVKLYDEFASSVQDIDIFVISSLRALSVDDTGLIDDMTF